MTLGGKYKWKADTNPPPGYYELKDALTKSKSFKAVINTADSKKGGRLGKNDFTKLKMAENPSGGEYDGHLTKLGDKMNNVTMGEKYKHTYNNNPPPGYYETNAADKLTKTKSKTAVFSRSDSKAGGRLGNHDFTKLKMAENPSGGEYDGHLTKLGDKMNNVTIGKKYKHTYNNNPPPGYYETNAADKLTKMKSKNGVFSKSDS